MINLNLRTVSTYILELRCRKKGLISEEDLRSALSAAVHARNATDLTARLAANHTEGLDNMYPDESPRMLVAVTSTCCGAESR